MKNSHWLEVSALTDRSDLHVCRVGHEEVTEEVRWSRSSRCSHSHDCVKCNRTRNVLNDIGDQSLTVDVSLEISVLEHFSTSQPRHLADRRQVDVGIVENEKIN